MPVILNPPMAGFSILELKITAPLSDAAGVLYLGLRTVVLVTYCLEIFSECDIWSESHKILARTGLLPWCNFPVAASNCFSYILIKVQQISDREPGQIGECLVGPGELTSPLINGCVSIKNKYFSDINKLL
jgi:hypothetical protein